jgi:hypothetical protein
VLVVTEAFESLAKLVAKQQGLADIRMIVVPHPLGGLPEPEVDRIAAMAGADALALLRKAHSSGT